MSALKSFLRIELVALAALLLAAGGMALIGVVDARSNPGSLFGPGDMAQLMFGFTLMLGLLPALVFGGPLYWWLQRKGKASWASAALLGLLPGALALFHDPGLGGYAMGCGLFVALATHALCRTPR